MKLEDQVCSLALAKRLKELGVKQESLFYHWATEVEQDGLTWWTIAEKEPRKGKTVRELSTPGHYRGPLSAFTVAELGEMLPARLEYSRKEHYTYRLAMEKQDTQWNVAFICADCGGRNFEPMLEDSEADARAKMLIYLLEKKLI